jgi:hypothetical protein
MSKFCPDCETEISDKVKFHPSCGPGINSFSVKNNVKVCIISVLVIVMLLISGCTSQDNITEPPTVTLAGGSPTITPAGGSCENYTQFEKPFEKIVTPLIPLTKNTQLDEISSNTNFRGKFLLWDITSNSLESCYFKMQYQAIPTDKIITVFFITERNSKPYGPYTEVNTGFTTGFRVLSEDVTIVAIEYPSQKVIGKKEISGTCPDRITRYLGQNLITLSAFSDIYDWTKSLNSSD